MAHASRRSFLRAFGSASAAALAAMALGERSARAFGVPPAGHEDALLRQDFRATSVLEIFFFGGLSQYESFYCVPDYGSADGTQLHAFEASGGLQKAVDACGLGAAPLTQPFAPDGNGEMVHFGPFAGPLLQRTDVLARTRVCVTAHAFEPHEVAVPLTIGGRALGHPALAGLGTHVERYLREKSPDNAVAPNSWVLSPSAAILGELTRAATSVGLHPSATRPVGLKVDAAQDFITLLARAKVGDSRAAYDALVQRSIDRYRGRLVRGGTPVRAARLDDAFAAASSIASSDVLTSILDPSLLATVAGSSCGAASMVDTTTMSLKLAAHLITHPVHPATYVSVFDGGFLPTADAGGYDSHADNCMIQSRNLTNALRALASIINAPGENDPTKLDLDRTLIILNTEFGRTPEAQGANGGRGHWPYGYPVVYMGGPIRAEAAGVYGAIGPDAKATTSLTPAEHRIAALDALGIWPFASEAFNVSDVQSAAGEVDGLASVRARALGVTS